MNNILNCFIMIYIFITNNIIIQNIKAANVKYSGNRKNRIFELTDIQEEEYEIDGKLKIFSNIHDSPQYKSIKITEIEYEGVHIALVDKYGSMIHVKESEFHRIRNGNLRLIDDEYYFEIISIVFKVTAFIEEKCFRTTLWCGCKTNPINISSPIDKIIETSLASLEMDVCYKGIILLQNDNFDNMITSDSQCLESQTIYYNVDSSLDKTGLYSLCDLTIKKSFNTYNINKFLFTNLKYPVYTKFYFKPSDRKMINGYIGNNIQQSNMNETISFFCTRTNSSGNKCNRKMIQNANNLEYQTATDDTLMML